MDIPQYMEQAQRLLLEAFPDRLVCLGLQGSYARDEATEKSDIDLVVILDRVAAADLLVYRDILNQLPEREKSCGFFSGKGELMAWDRGELFRIDIGGPPMERKAYLITHGEIPLGPAARAFVDQYLPAPPEREEKAAPKG